MGKKDTSYLMPMVDSYLNWLVRYCASPARTVKYIRSLPVETNIKRAGESALAELTDLSKPKTDTYAVAANDWRSIATAFDLVEVDENEFGSRGGNVDLRSGWAN